MDKLYLSIEIGEFTYNVSFGSLEDVLSDSVWSNAVNNLHAMIKSNERETHPVSPE